MELAEIKKQSGLQRVCISDTTRMLLCGFAAGDLTKPLPRLEANWEEVFGAVRRNGLLGLTFRYLETWDSDDYPPLDFRLRVQQMYRLNALPMAMMYRRIGQVLTHLADANVGTLVLKGPALAYSVYPDPALRTFSDLDIVVRERDWSAAHRVLLELGFSSEDNLAQPPPKLVSQAVVYERRYWHKENKWLVEIHYDDLLNAGLASCDVDGFWRRAAPVNIGRVPAQTLALEDQLIHSCAHAHFHGYIRLNWFSDMAFIVRDHGAKLDWERLLERVRIEEAQVPVYYGLRFLGKLLGVCAPEPVLAALKPDSFRLRFHEYYLPEAKVLSWQPMSRPDFSFYFVPLRMRLLPDLLVMGRRRDKLRYLRRLLLPPQAWLRYYYHITGTQNIAVYYLLHPLKLMYHYLTELVLVKRSTRPRDNRRHRTT
jgi:Uncharacterised nucleotidyltransferase